MNILNHPLLEKYKKYDPALEDYDPTLGKMDSKAFLKDYIKVSESISSIIMNSRLFKNYSKTGDEVENILKEYKKCLVKIIWGGCTVKRSRRILFDLREAERIYYKAEDELDDFIVRLRWHRDNSSFCPLCPSPECEAIDIEYACPREKGNVVVHNNEGGSADDTLG